MPEVADRAAPTKAEIKSETAEWVADVSRVPFLISKGTKNSEDLWKAAKEFGGCDTSISRAEEILRRIYGLSEEMEFTRICILKNLSRAERVPQQIEQLLESVKKQTN